MHITKTRGALVLVAFSACLLTVGLMAGLINQGCPQVGGTGDTEATTTSTKPTPTNTDIPPGEDGPWRDPFLPDNTIPIHYNLSLYPDFYHDGNSFTGQVAIVINVTQDTSCLIVHINYLNITETKVTDYYTNRELELLGEPFEYSENQYWVTKLSDEIPSGSTVVLHLEFSGSLVNGIVGYYKSNYTNTQTGVTSWLATTKFQPTDARKAYPCFDEPDLKATFTVSLKHWQNFTALSNMPVKETIEEDAVWNITTFEQSVPMSTYLVAFIVCDFNYTENLIDGSNVPHRVWSSPDKVGQTILGLETGKVIAEWFQLEFNMNFQLPKLDQVAIPDYPSGATEHWGLVTYRESRLLFDETQVAVSGEIITVKIVCHELAHNYFGNVITNYWWDDIWLHEGFAVLYEYIGLNVSQPTWGLDYLFVTETMQSVMRTDALNSSKPVVGEVTTPDEINQAFDGIAYDKGASILRMMQSFLGEELFRNGIRRFLAEHEYKTVVTQDLWNALQQEIGGSLNITEVMNPWVYQMGFPVINITDLGDGNLHAEQARFLSNPSTDPTQPPSQYNYKWYVPLSYITASDTTVNVTWLNMTDGTFPDPREGNDWIKFNPGQTGFYRVNYAIDMWTTINNQLSADFEVFQPVDRSNLLDDAFNLARASLLDYSTALSMTSYLTNEHHLYPWTSVKLGFDYITAMMYGHEEYYMWRNYIENITLDTMEWLQIKDEGSHSERLLRLEIIQLSCGNDNADCIRNITEKFQKWIEDPIGNVVEPSLRQEVYSIGLKTVGTVTEWEIVWKRYEEATSSQEQAYLLFALAQVKDIWLLQRYISYCEDESKVRAQDFFIAIGYLNYNPVGNTVAWNWARENYQALIDRFGIHDRVFGTMVPDMVTYYKTEFQLREVEEFFAEYPEAGAGAGPRNQALETIRANIAWIEKNQQEILDWLHMNS